MNKLFELDSLDRKLKASDVLSKLIKIDFLKEHKNYILTHFNGNDSSKYEQFNSRIKSLYKRFVLDENMEESDFVNTLDLICTLNKKIDNATFRDTFIDFKSGLYDYLYEDEEGGI